MRSRPTRRRTFAAAAVVATTALAACTTIPYDFTDPRGADVVTADASSGQWRDALTNEVIWTSPDPASIAVPGNYDGLGRWEPASYSDGHWYTAGDRGTIDLPEPADPFPSNSAFVMPVPADYDGDGRTEPGYYVGDTGVWVIEGLYPFVFGRPTDAPDTPFSGTREAFHDVPVPADYDGDGLDDPAVYRVETGDIHVWRQAGIATGVPFGFPTSANFNDGPGDEAAVMPVGGGDWFVEGDGVVDDGSDNDSPAPVAADYDGDGFDDVAVIENVGTGKASRVVIDGGARIVPIDDGWPGPVASRPANVISFLALTFHWQRCVSGFNAPEPGCP